MKNLQIRTILILLTITLSIEQIHPKPYKPVIGEGLMMHPNAEAAYNRRQTATATPGTIKTSLQGANTSGYSPTGKAVSSYKANHGSKITSAQTNLTEINDAKTTTIGTYTPEAQTAYGIYGGSNMSTAHQNAEGSNITAAQEAFKANQGTIAQSIHQAASENNYFAPGAALANYYTNQGSKILAAQANKAKANSEGYYATGQIKSKANSQGYYATGNAKAQANSEDYYADGGTQAQELQTQYIANNNSTSTTDASSTSSSATAPTLYKPVIGEGLRMHPNAETVYNSKTSAPGTIIANMQTRHATTQADKTAMQAANTSAYHATGAHASQAVNNYGTYGGSNITLAQSERALAENDKSAMQAANTSGYTATGAHASQAAANYKTYDGSNIALAQSERTLAENDKTTLQADNTSAYHATGAHTSQATTNYKTYDGSNMALAQSERALAESDRTAANTTAQGYKTILQADNTSGYTATGIYAPEAISSYKTYDGSYLATAEVDDSTVKADRNQANTNAQADKAALQANNTSGYTATGAHASQAATNYKTYGGSNIAVAKTERALAESDKTTLQADNTSGYTATGAHASQAAANYKTYGGSNIAVAKTERALAESDKTTLQADNTSGYTATGAHASQAATNYEAYDGSNIAIAQADKASINAAGYTKTGALTPEAETAYTTYGGENIAYAHTNSDGSNITAAQTKFKTNQGSTAQAIQEADSDHDHFANGTALASYSINHGTNVKATQADKATANSLGYYADGGIRAQEIQTDRTATQTNRPIKTTLQTGKENINDDGYYTTGNSAYKVQNAYSDYSGDNIKYTYSANQGSKIPAVQKQFGLYNGGIIGAEKESENEYGNYATGIALNDYATTNDTAAYADQSIRPTNQPIATTLQAKNTTGYTAQGKAFDNYLTNHGTIAQTTKTALPTLQNAKTSGVITADESKAQGDLTALENTKQNINTAGYTPAQTNSSQIETAYSDYAGDNVKYAYKNNDGTLIPILKEQYDEEAGVAAKDDEPYAHGAYLNEYATDYSTTEQGYKSPYSQNQGSLVTAIHDKKYQKENSPGMSYSSEVQEVQNALITRANEAEDPVEE